MCCVKFQTHYAYIYKSTYACYMRMRESWERPASVGESMQRARGAKYNHIIFWRLVPREIYINIRWARVAKRSYGIGLFWIVKEFFLFNTAIKHIAKQLMRACVRARERKRRAIFWAPLHAHYILIQINNVVCERTSTICVGSLSLIMRGLNAAYGPITRALQHQQHYCPSFVARSHYCASNIDSAHSLRVCRGKQYRRTACVWYAIKTLAMRLLRVGTTHWMCVRRQTIDHCC